LAVAKWLGFCLLASAWLQLSGWAIGYWLLASAIGLAAAKGLGFGFWLQLLAWLRLRGLALAFGFSYWLGYGCVASARLGFGLSGFAWLWLVAWLLLGCFGLALDRLGCS
jgi:hypothetical protein